LSGDGPKGDAEPERTSKKGKNGPKGSCAGLKNVRKRTEIVPKEADKQLKKAKQILTSGGQARGGQNGAISKSVKRKSEQMAQKYVRAGAGKVLWCRNDGGTGGQLLYSP
jgi:hypothetical protein